MGTFIYTLGGLETLAILILSIAYALRPKPLRRRFHSIINSTAEWSAYEHRR